jgi:hypothetical protein
MSFYKKMKETSFHRAIFIIKWNLSFSCPRGLFYLSVFSVTYLSHSPSPYASLHLGEKHSASIHRRQRHAPFVQKQALLIGRQVIDATGASAIGQKDGTIAFRD